MKILLYSLVLFSVMSCSSQKEVESKSPFPIEEVYFQKWIGGQKLTGGGTNYHLKFKNTLPSSFSLTKLYCVEGDANFEKYDEKLYIARFTFKPNNDDIILEDNPDKEYGNKTPEESKNKFDLKPNEVIIEYQENNETKFFKIENIKEHELIAYPVSKPRN